MQAYLWWSVESHYSCVPGMKFLKSFRLSNHYISIHVLLLLRFYLAQFYYLGLFRLRYVRERNSVFLTPYSVTVSRLVGIPFAFLISFWLYQPYHKLVYLQPFVFMCCLLFQPRRTSLRWIKLINKFLRLAPVLHRLSHRKLQMSWFLILQLFLKLLTLRLYLVTLKLMPMGTFLAIMWLLVFAVPTTISIWCLDISTHLINIAMTILLKSFEQINDELARVNEQMQLKMLQANYRTVARLQHRMLRLQRLHAAYVSLTQKMLISLAPKLLLIVVYNLSMVYALSRSWRRFFEIGILFNSLRILFQSFSALLKATTYPYDTSWLQVAQLLQLHRVLDMHGWRTHRHLLYTMDNKNLHHCLMQQHLHTLGKFKPSRRLFFRLFVAYCFYLHLHFMWHKRWPVGDKDIFLSLS